MTRKMKSFLICFFTLDQCYFQNKENDLGIILGAMSPELCTDGMPVDLAMLNDWERICSLEDVNKPYIVEKILEFLELYETEFGFSFYKTKELLKSAYIEPLIDQAMIKATEAGNK